LQVASHRRDSVRSSCGGQDSRLMKHRDMRVTVVMICMLVMQCAAVPPLVKQLLEASQQYQQDGLPAVLSRLRAQFSCPTVNHRTKTLTMATHAILLCSHERILEMEMAKRGRRVSPHDVQAVVRASGYPGDADAACRAAIRATFNRKKTSSTCVAYMPQLEAWFGKFEFALVPGEIVAVDEISNVCGDAAETVPWMYLRAIADLLQWRRVGLPNVTETHRVIVSIGERLSQTPSRMSAAKGHLVLGLSALLEDRFGGRWVSEALSHWKQYRVMMRDISAIGVVKHLYCTLADSVIIAVRYDGSVDLLDMVGFVQDYKLVACVDLSGPPSVQLDRIRLGIALVDRDLGRARTLLARPGVAQSTPATIFPDLDTFLLFGQFVSAAIDATDRTIASDPRMVNVYAAATLSNIAKSALANACHPATPAILVAFLATNPHLFIDNDNMPTKVTGILDNAFRDDDSLLQQVVAGVRSLDGVVERPGYSESPFSTLASALNENIELPYDDDDASPTKLALHLDTLAGHISVGFASNAPASASADDLLALAMIGCTSIDEDNPFERYAPMVNKYVPPHVGTAVAIVRRLVQMLDLRPGWWTESRISRRGPPRPAKKHLDALYSLVGRRSDDMRVRLLVAFACRITIGVASDLNNLCSRKATGPSSAPDITMPDLQDGFPSSFKLVHRLLLYMKGEITGQIVTTDLLFSVDNYLMAGMESRLSQEDVHDLVVVTRGASPLAVEMFRQTNASEETVFFAGLVVTYLNGKRHDRLRSTEVLDVYRSLFVQDSLFWHQCELLRQRWFPESPPQTESPVTLAPESVPTVSHQMTPELEQQPTIVISRSPSSEVPAAPRKARVERRRQTAPAVIISEPTIPPSRRRGSSVSLSRTRGAATPRSGISTDEEDIASGFTLNAFVHKTMDPEDIAEIRAFVQERPALLSARGPFIYRAKLIASGQEAGHPLWRLRHGRKRLFFVLSDDRMKFTGVARRDSKTYARAILDAQMKIAQAPDNQWMSI
ncbi:hypothetical protein PBRA_000046, partial [Plasmodiophora brassicae]